MKVPEGEKGAGILSVDDHVFDHAQPIVFVGTGPHVIGYSCPGYIILDNAPEVSKWLWAGETYVFKCDKGDAVLLVGKIEAP